MSDPAPILKPLEERLILAVQDFLQTPITTDESLEAARAAVAALAFKRREEDAVITPEDEAAKLARLVVTVTDNGRYKITPYRIFRMEFAIRANGQVPAGLRDAFVDYCGALEALLDGLNLQDALTSQARGAVVKLAVRKPGIAHSVSGSIRTESYALDVRAIGLEHTESV